MVKLGPWPKGDGNSGYGKAGTVAKKGTGTVGMVELVRWLEQQAGVLWLY